MVWIGPEPGSLCKAQYTCKNRWLCSCQHSTLCSLFCSGAPLPLQKAHCSQSNLYFPAKFMLISVFSPSLFYVCPTNKIQCKWVSEGGAVVFFGTWWPSEQRWTRLEPKICLLLGRKRCLKAASQPCCLHKTFMLQPCVVIQRGFLGSLVIFLSIPRMLLLSDRKHFSFSLPDT